MLARIPALVIAYMGIQVITPVIAFPAPFSVNLPRADTCGGVSSLSPCGSSFPSDFCCPQATTCLPLNVTGAVAIVCCPLGSSCETIQPTTCDQTAYNASKVPQNQIHSNPTIPLTTCGSACCPMGYACQSGMCVAVAAPALQSSSASSSTSATSSTSSTGSTSTSSLTSSTTAKPSPSEVAVGPGPSPIPEGSPPPSFSGIWFAAGFVPGVIIGMLLIFTILICLRKYRGPSQASEDRKHFSNDQLTNLSPLDGPRRPVFHSRSISEPTVDATGGHRTDFLRSSPANPLSKECLNDRGVGENSSQAAPVSLLARDPKPKPLFSISPRFHHTQSPLPAHMKRGTLSYAITPIRQLRTKKSMHSLRRHVTDASTSSRSSSRRHRPYHSRNSSTETIQVLMPSIEPYTPASHHVQEPATLSSARYCPTNPSSENLADTRFPTHRDSLSHNRPIQASSIYSPPQNMVTPTRQAFLPRSPKLGTPYVPSRVHERHDRLGVPDGSGGKDRRVTTFSNLMEKAGIRKEDFCKGPPPPQ